MHPKKALTAAAATASLRQRANGQQLFDDSVKPKGANETIYGPLNVIEIPYFPSTFNQYPNIDPEIRKTINNGGLDPTCSQCNSTGCMCPDKHSNISFNSLCEGCRATGDGALRCYCSPALFATPCNGSAALTTCNDLKECKDALHKYFCVPQHWGENPALQTLTEPTVVYGVASATVMPPGIGALPTDGFTGKRIFPPQQGKQPSGSPQTVPTQAPRQGAASRKGARLGAAAVAAAGMVAAVMEPFNQY